MNWYTDWFNSPYYHILYKNRDDKEAQFFIDNLIKHLKIKKNSKILDVACGKGRHAYYFHKKNMIVNGIDISLNSINDAKKNKKIGLNFFVHDMRIPFKLKEFDVITNLFTSFGYFDCENDELIAIKSITSSLKKNGILIIDFLNIIKVKNHLIYKEEKKIDGIDFKIERSFDNSKIYKKISFTENKKTYNYIEKVRALGLSNFEHYLSAANMKVVNIFGNYNLEKFDEKKSDRLILICKCV